MSDEVNGVTTPEKYAIGISFGNSYSSIAHISGEGKVEVIANEEGDRQIPSVLSYVEGEEYHGTQAKAQLVRNAKNTIAFFRDYLGKTYDQIDPSPSKYSAKPQEVDGKVVYEVADVPESDKVSKVDISTVTTRHIQKLKESAGNYIGKTITSAVVSVPTDTTAEQKAALTKAAKDANLEVLQFINEPTAAVLAYDARAIDSIQDRTILVADFGGTRSDAAVIVCSGGGLYSILATTHDYELGGTQLDQVLIDHFAKEFEKKNKVDPRKNDRSLAKMKLEAENVKKTLSQSATATFSVESLADGIDFRSTVNRTRYQLLAVKQFQRFTRLVEEVVKKAGLDLLDIDEVIMSGGTSSTPKIAENIQALFPETTTVHAPATSTSSLIPSELSVRGAAIQASMIQDIDKEDIAQSTHEVVTVTPHTKSAIGVQISGQPAEQFTVIVPATTAVPARRSKTISVATEGDVLLLVSEAESSIRITKPEAKPKTNGATVEDGKDSDADSDEDDDEEDEDEETRSKIWKVTQPLAEFVFRGLKVPTKLEVTVNVAADLALSITARETKGKSGGSSSGTNGVRGSIAAPKVTENGSV